MAKNDGFILRAPPKLFPRVCRTQRFQAVCCVSTEYKPPLPTGTIMKAYKAVDFGHLRLRFMQSLEPRNPSPTAYGPFQR